jgi:hypothetical protein
MAGRRRIQAEAVDLADGAAVETAIVGGVAVQHEVARARGQIPTGAHAVVQREPLETVPVAAGHAETLGQGVAARDHHPIAVGPDLGEVEDQSFARIGPIADAALDEIEDDGPRRVGGGEMRVVQMEGAAPDPNRVAGLREPLF